MRDALLQSLYPKLSTFGNDLCNNYQVQAPNSNVSMQMDSEIYVNGSGFCIKPGVFNNEHLQLGNGRLTVPFRPLINYGYQSGYQSCPYGRVDSPQQAALLSGNSLVPQFEAESQAMPNMRKRPIEVDSILPTRGAGMIDDLSASHEWKMNKRNKATTSEQQWQPEVSGTSTYIQEQSFHAPVRRSQKLSDKVTALQKLVSPYGKTDTASVLQEASLYIKLLHEQIQTLFGMLSSSYRSVRACHHQEIEGQLDLRSKGLCLVPLSFTNKVKMERQVDYRALCCKPIANS